MDPSLKQKSFFQTLIEHCHTSGLTLQEGGCSDLEKKADGSVHWTDPDGKQRSVLHIQNVHLKEEVFLFGNLLSAIVCCVYLTRGLFGLLAGVLSFSYAWKKIPTFKKWTHDLTNVPSYALKVIPLVGNAYAAKLNKEAFENASLSLPVPLPVPLIKPIQGDTPPLPPTETSNLPKDPPILPETHAITPPEQELVAGLEKEEAPKKPESDLEKSPSQVFQESETAWQPKMLHAKEEVVKILQSLQERVDFGAEREKSVQNLTVHLTQYLFYLPHTELLQLEADRLERRPVKIPSIDASLVIPEDIARPIIAKEVLRRASPTEYLAELLGYSPELLAALQKNRCQDAYGRQFDKTTIQLAQILQSAKDKTVPESLSNPIQYHESAKKFLQDHLSKFGSEVSFFSPPPSTSSSFSKPTKLDPSIFSFEKTLGVQYDIQEAATSSDDTVLEVYGVASQANLSENTVPQPVPLGRGVSTYRSDPTQGPTAQLCFHPAQVELLAAAGNLGFNSLVKVLDESTKKMVQHGYCQPASDPDCTTICEQVKTKGKDIEYACVTSTPKGGHRPVSLLFGFAPCFVDTKTCAMYPIDSKNRDDLSYQIALQSFRAQLAQVVRLAKTHPSKKIIFKPTGLGLGVFQNSPKAIERAYLEACQEFAPQLKQYNAKVRWQVFCRPQQRPSSVQYTYERSAYEIAQHLELQEHPRSLDSLAAQQISKNKTPNILVEQLPETTNWTSDQVKEIIQNSKKIAEKISLDCADQFKSAFFSINSGMKNVAALCQQGVLGSALRSFSSTLPVVLPIPPGLGSAFSRDVLLACHNRAKVFLQKSFTSLGTSITFYSPPPLWSGRVLPEYAKDFTSKTHLKLDARVFTTSKMTRIQDVIRADEDQTGDTIIAYGLDNQWNGIPSPHRRPVAIGEGTTILSSPQSTPGAQVLASLPPEQTELLNLGAHLGFNSLMPILDNNTKTSTSYGYLTPNTPDKFQNILKKFKEGGGKIEYLSIDKTKNRHFLFTGLPAWGRYSLDDRITPDQEKELSYYVALAGFRAQFAQILHLANHQKKSAILKLSEGNLASLGQDPEVIVQAYCQASLEFSENFLKNHVQIQWLFIEETPLTERIKKLIAPPASVAETLPPPFSVALPEPITPPAAPKKAPQLAPFPITKEQLTACLKNCAKKFKSYFYQSKPQTKIPEFIAQSVALDGSKTTIDILPIPDGFTKEATIAQQRACHEKAKIFLQQSLPVVSSTPQFVSPPKRGIKPYKKDWTLPSGQPLDTSVFSWERTSGVLQDIQKDAHRAEDTLVLYGAASQFNGAEAMMPSTILPGHAHALYQSDLTQGPQAQLAFAKEQVELINIGANLGWNGLCHVLDDRTKSALQHGYLIPTKDSCDMLIQQCQERGHLAEFPCIEGFPGGTTKKSVHLMLVAAPAFGSYLTSPISKDTQDVLAYHIATICWRAQFHQALQLAQTSGKPVIFKAAGVGLGVFENAPEAVAQAYYHVGQEFVEEFKKHHVSVRWQLFGGDLSTPSGRTVSLLKIEKTSKP